jgi:phospholipase C
MGRNAWSRREFLAASAGLIAGACAGGGSKTPAPAKNAAPNASTFPQFDHLVVLMFENRSFDNMLGYLYQPNQVPRNQQFDGVVGKDLFNIAPDGTKVPVRQGTVMNDPNPDPGEEYPHINTDFFNTVLPPSNAVQPVKDMQAPFNAPTPIPNPAPMSGFVHDYVNRITGLSPNGHVPTPAEYGIIMNCFAPDAVPVISQLAKGFGVADHWFCEVPSQTFCNRSFFHAGSSSGFTSNEPYTQFPFNNGVTTVFDRLNAAGVKWHGYYDQRQLLPLTFLIHFPRLMNQLPSFLTMNQFYDDVKNGNLPAYSFIEPNMLVNHNDEHPPAALIGPFVPPSNVLNGEALLAEVYNAIRTSNSPKGSNWSNTALLITYDEGGGCYDHVSPPQGVPAPPPNPNGNEEGFAFDRLGERVPAVLVSAHTAAGTIVNREMRHTAVIKTMSEKWNFSSLTARDKSAPDLAPFFNLQTPRQPSDWPTVNPRPLPLVSDQNALAELLNELQRDLIGAADAHKGTPNPAAVDNLKTVGDGVAYLQQKFPELKQ